MTDPNPVTIGELSRRQAVRRGGDVAMVFGERETSYAALDRHASQVANGLAAAGLEPGARVGLLAKNSDRYYELLFGCAKAGAVLVPVNWRLAAPEIAYVVADSGAEILLVGRDFVDVVEGLLPELPSVRTVIAFDEAYRDREPCAAWRDRQSDAEPAYVAAAEDAVLQMYTSGTTGHPKGARLSNRALCTEMRVVHERMGDWDADDRSLVVMPQFHIAGTVWGCVGLYGGVTIVVMPEVDPGAILEHIRRDGITKLFLVPAVILFMLQHPACAATDFSRLKLILYGASPITADLLTRARAVFGCAFAQVYGLTETTGAITYLDPADHERSAGARLTSCGTPLSTVEVRIVDGAGADLSPGEVGEVICRTPLNMDGYWNLPDATAAALRDGWFHTGDAGYMDADGYLYIHDRVKDMIITGGENVYPAEVESALATHPDVVDVAVIGVPDETWGEAVKAVVVRAPASAVSAEELIAFARGCIAAFKAPKSVDFAAELPRNPSGKVLKRALRKPYWEGRARQVQ